MKKPVCYNKETLQVLDFDNHVIATAPTLMEAIDLTRRLNSGAQFKEFETLPVPAFLNTPEWLDESWHNDVTAHVRLDTPKSNPFELWVWVHPENPDDREDPDYPRFVVSIYDAGNGDELDWLFAETEEFCRAVIKEWRARMEHLSR